MKQFITADAAIRSAVNELTLENEDWLCTGIVLSDNLYELNIHTICMKYLLFVDAGSGFVLGISSEPYVDLGAVYPVNPPIVA